MKTPIVAKISAFLLLWAVEARASIITEGKVFYLVDVVTEGVPVQAAEATPLLAGEIDGYKTAWRWFGPERQAELEKSYFDGVKTCGSDPACRVAALIKNTTTAPGIDPGSWQRYVWFVQARFRKDGGRCAVTIDLFGNALPAKPFLTQSAPTGCSKQELLSGMRSSLKAHFDVPKAPADFKKFDGLHLGNREAPTKVLIWVNPDDKSIAFLRNELPALVRNHGKNVHFDVRFVADDHITAGAYCAAFFGKGLEALKSKVDIELPQDEWVRQTIKAIGVDKAGFEYCVKENALSDFTIAHYQPFHTGASMREIVMRKIPYILVNDVPVDGLTEAVLVNPPVKRELGLKRKIIAIE